MITWRTMAVSSLVLNRADRAPLDRERGPLMNFRDELARVIANDPRYSIEAYAFILESLNQARHQKLKSLGRDRGEESAPKSSGEARRAEGSPKKPRVSGHVSGGELCEVVRKLALRQYGLLASTVLAHWGIASTSDIGDIVYNLIAAGDLEKTPSDSRSDFDNVFDFDTAFKAGSSEAAGDSAAKPGASSDRPAE
jgi:uncharacterized repeat protein (TIGR04138 family)